MMQLVSLFVSLLVVGSSVGQYNTNPWAGPVMVTQGYRGQPSTYQCPVAYQYCYSNDGHYVDWQHAAHQCLVKYSDGSQYCYIRLSQDCYAFPNKNFQDCPPM